MIKEYFNGKVIAEDLIVGNNSFETRYTIKYNEKGDCLGAGCKYFDPFNVGDSVSFKAKYSPIFGIFLGGEWETTDSTGKYVDYEDLPGYEILEYKILDKAE